MSEEELVKLMRHAGLCQRHLEALLDLNGSPRNRDGECMYCGKRACCEDCAWVKARVFFGQCVNFDRHGLAELLR